MNETIDQCPKHHIRHPAGQCPLFLKKPHETVAEAMCRLQDDWFNAVASIPKSAINQERTDER